MEQTGSLISCMSAFMATNTGKSLFLFALCAGVMLFLRLLYGPRGFWREKRWDEMNKEFKMREEALMRVRQAKNMHKKRRALLAPLLQNEWNIFSAYAEEYYSGNAENDRPVSLKLEHTASVLKNAWIIAAREEVFYLSCRDTQRNGLPELDRALLLAALYHDVGRFEQIKRFGTFKDADSINHGLLGAKELANGRFMRSETPEARRLVRGAILMHNRLRLPSSMPRPLELVLQGVRDADKLDIINVMTNELAPGKEQNKTVTLGLSDIPGQYSPHALKAVMEGESVEYAAMRSVNDFRLLLCSWVPTLVFASSKRLLTERGHMEDILAGLPVNDEMDRVRAKVRMMLKI